MERRATELSADVQRAVRPIQNPDRSDGLRLLFLLRLQIRVTNPTCGAHAAVGGNYGVRWIQIALFGAQLSTGSKQRERINKQKKKKKQKTMERTTTTLSRVTPGPIRSLKRLARASIHAHPLTHRFDVRACVRARVPVDA